MKRSFAIMALALLLGAPLAARAEDVGSVASLNGKAEIGRDGQWIPAETGMPVQLGDQLRTADGRLKVVFQDDSVLNLGENTTLTIDDQVFQPQQGTFKSLMKLIRGKVRATVGSYYQQTGAAYEVETPTAVAGVRGTTFIVSYDEADETTEVLGIRGRVHVRGLNERLGQGVFVSARESTAVGANGRATPPERLNEEMLHQRLEGLEVISRRGMGGLLTGAAVQTGAAVAVSEHAPSTTKRTSIADELHDPGIGDVLGQPVGTVQATRGSLGVPF